jgi:chromosome segregation ATPase
MKISSLLREAENPNQGTVKQLSVDKDLIYRARNKYPGYSPEQAMILLISDEMKNQEKTDSVQNKLIDTQKRENERLRGAVDSLGQELQDFEQQSQETDREVERLKQLSSTLTAGGTDTKRKAKLSADDLEKLHTDLETLKTKPGMDPKKFQQLEQQINLMASNPSASNTDLSKINSLVDTLNKQKTIGDDLYKKVEDQLALTQQDLNKKEGRFSKYIEKKKGEVGVMQKTHADEIKKYSDIVQGYENQIQDFGKQMSDIEQQLAAAQKEKDIIKREKDITLQLRAGAQQDAQTVADMKDQIQNQFELITNMTSKMTGQAGQAGQASNDEKVVEPTGSGPQADILTTMNRGSGTEKNISQGAQKMIGRKFQAEGAESNKPIRPLQKYNNPKYNEWITKHLPALVQVFKNKYWTELEKPESQYSDDQIHYIIEKYTPMLYNLGDEKTPLTKEQVDNWLIVVKDNLWEQPVQNQLELFNESLDKTYARMLDNIIGLDYIKKG